MRVRSTALLPQKKTHRSLEKKPKGKGKNGGTATAWRTLVTSDRKLTVRGDWKNVEHLFDLKVDPLEKRNLAKDPERQKEIAGLQKQLKQAAEETGDTFPLRPKAARKSYSDKEAAAVRS